MNRKIILTIVLIVTVILAVLYFTNNKEVDNNYIGNNNTYNNEQFTEDQAKYFEMEAYESATYNGLIPIEGFDADLLLGALPGLEKSDFEGVKTYEGTYNIENGELTFKRDRERPISTIEKTLTTEGYVTLLENLSARYDMSIKSNADIDLMVKRIGEED